MKDEKLLISTQTWPVLNSDLLNPMHISTNDQKYKSLIGRDTLVDRSFQDAGHFLESPEKFV